MAPAPKTKSQAQKKAEREEQIAAAAAARKEEAERKKAMFAKQYGGDDDDSDDDDKKKKKGGKGGNNKNREKKPWEVSDDDDTFDYGEEEEEEEEEQEEEESNHEDNDGDDDSDNKKQNKKSFKSEFQSGKTKRQLRTMKNAKEQHHVGEIKKVIEGGAGGGPSSSSSVTNNNTSRARLVMNHSTHCDSLIPVLRKLTLKLDERYTITPGVLSNQGSTQRMGGLVLSKQRSDIDTCLRILAKNGSTIQEVAIQTPADADHQRVFELAQTCLEYICQKVREINDDDEGTNGSGVGPGGAPIVLVSNKDVAEALRLKTISDQKLKGQEEHLQKVALDRQHKEEQAEKERQKKLVGKVGKEAAAAYAERDEEIVSGKSRGKHAMK